MAKTKKISRQWARDESKELFWNQKIIEHASSGISISEFCRRENISSNSFNSWRRELIIRERERAARGQISLLPLPTYPDRVKDSRGRIIPARLAKWLDEEKRVTPESKRQSPFVPLKIVEPSVAHEPACLAILRPVEVVSPSGFIVRLSGDLDLDNLKKIFTALEK